MLGRLARGLTGLLPGRRARRSDSERAGWLEQAKARLDAGGFADAAVLFERILSIAPDDIEALKGRAGLHRYAGEFEEALALADEILAQAPDDIDAWCIRAFSERGRGRLDAALQAFRRAVAIEARAGLIACVGGILFQQGEIVAALNEMDHAIAADPEADFIHSNRLFMLNHDTRMSADAVAREHFAWGRSVEARMAPWRRPHDNDRSPDRRLRIGYVSADFRTHSVAFFFAPVLAAHDRSQVEVFCYDNQAGPGDAFTRRLQGMANHWIRTAAMDDPALATRIRADAIDILVDMSGHTGGNRLPVFAMQPAPLAVTWFGYMNTTGLATIDYRITDYSLCPPGSEPRYSETIHRVHGMAAWSAAPDSPQIGRAHV